MLDINSTIEMLTNEDKKKILNSSKEFIFIEMLWLAGYRMTRTNDNRSVYIDRLTKMSLSGEEIALFYTDHLKDLLK